MSGRVIWLAFGALLMISNGPAQSRIVPLFTGDDYPRHALAAGHEGTVEFKVTIGTDGRAKDCRITRSSGYADLDEPTCQMILKRAKFKPARDATGNLVESTYQSFVTWTLPR